METISKLESDSAGGDMETHEYCQIFPEMDTASFNALKEDIRLHGQRETVITFEGKILDGRHRYRACSDLMQECRTSEYAGHDALAFVISTNLRRRHLDESQRGMIVAKMDALSHGGERGNQHAAKSPIGDLPTRKQAAELLNVGTGTIDRARAVLKHGSPELVAAVERGEVKVGAAAEVAKLPEEEQRAVVERGPAAVKEKASVLRTERFSPEAQRRAEEAEKDSERLWLLKSTWRQAAKKDRSAFQIWTKQQDILKSALDAPEAPTGGPIRFRPQEGLHILQQGIATIRRVSKDDVEFEAAYRGLIDYCEGQLAKAGKK